MVSWSSHPICLNSVSRFCVLRAECQAVTQSKNMFQENGNPVNTRQRAIFRHKYCTFKLEYDNTSFRPHSLAASPTFMTLSINKATFCCFLRDAALGFCSYRRVSVSTGPTLSPSPLCQGLSTTANRPVSIVTLQGRPRDALRVRTVAH